jgi:hypothetical protein
MRYPWEEQYLVALEETDPTRLPRLIAFAETAIYGRLRILDEERQALCEAASQLRRGDQTLIGELDANLTDVHEIKVPSPAIASK